ncbi:MULTISPECIES: GNAT family N-acetyltransferase [unclassified Thioalkalivibrio]|uniref:GNAT family N-acetyltransferase n=1 Tax=unclassified Thioalkalivibrio TaxID=2621013 RepID=UPI00036BB718|nr:MULTISPECIES: GNAT family N-acyltransferase [unclassified Thioalkalivibrio]
MTAPHLAPPIPDAGTESAYRVHLASSPADLEAAQRLRHEVFAGEMGANLPDGETGLDRDPLDPFCHHLLVRDRHSGDVVACTRLLTEESASTAGGFYSLSEFELGPLMNLPGRTLEIGRTCVASSHRQGAAINALWAGLARFMNAHRYDYLIGCASLPLSEQTPSQLAWLRLFHRAPSRLRVTPRRPLPNSLTICHGTPSRTGMPPLLKAYLRLGARVCGEACFDPDFNVADVLILLDVRTMPDRYHRHFMGATAPVSRGTEHDRNTAGTG